ncbi:hypothetical protein KEM60_01772 [Austwickia sp. TVS 96-490-7B]|nr:hypothetical protein [Austwickia sp. TVS 96-490-7B]
MSSFGRSLARLHPLCSLDDVDWGISVRSRVDSPRALFSFCLPSQEMSGKDFPGRVANYLISRRENGVIWDFDESGSRKNGFRDMGSHVEKLKSVQLMHLDLQENMPSCPDQGTVTVCRVGRELHPGAFRAMHDVQSENFGVGALGKEERCYVLEPTLFRSGKQCAVVVFFDGVPVASGVMWVEGQSACLFWIFCKEDFRGMGFGGQVVRELCRWAATRGCHEVLLQSTKDGKKLYTGLGFRYDGKLSRWMMRGAGLL